MRQLKNFKASTSSADDVTDAFKKYDGMKESDLMSELMKKVSSAKSDGSFSASQLDEFVRLMSPQLDDAQKRRLKELVEMIKGG